jgi:hypothetical protein
MLGHLHVCIEVDVRIVGFLIITLLAESTLGL